mgnify:CR=1 FL=1
MDNITKCAQEILKDIFGYDSFRPLQLEIIKNLLAGKDTLAIMPTGGGKSLCYQIPALIFKGITIVVSPLISLMQDQVSSLKENGVPAEFLNSSLEFSEYLETVKKLKDGEIKIVYVSPEGLASDKMMGIFHECSMPINCITIDEAHCVSEWGHDFRPDYLSISNVRKHFPNAVCLALTATATASVQQDLKDVTLQLWLDGKLLATEELGAVIGSMETYKYTFQTRVDCSEAGTHKITVKNATPGCEALGNGELSTDIVIGDGTVSYPESMSANSYYYIKNVKVGDIDNTSEASTYSDFTDMKTSIQPGGTLTLSVTPNNKFVAIGAWIDWNGNGSFDDVGETLELRDGTGEVRIPAGSNVKPGDKRLRIVASFDTPQPTGTYDFGETEDYTITVVNGENLPAISLSAEMLEAATSGDKKAIPLSIANNGGETLTGELKYDYILPNAPTSNYTICRSNVPAEVKGKLLRRAAVMGVANPDASEGTEYVLKYDKGQDGLTGISNSGTAIYANYYPGNMLSALSGMEITSVDVYIGTPATDNSIVIYGEGTQSKNGSLIAEKEFYVDKNSWNHIVLDKPVKIGDTDLWIGYKTSGLTGSQYCIGIDKGSAIVGFGDMVNIDGDKWWSMSDLGMDFNYCIRANVSGKRTPAINWLSLDKKLFEVAPGSSTTLNVNVDASELDKALYEAKIEVVSNDGLSSAIDIPVYIVNDATTGIYAKAYTGDTTIKLGNRLLSVSAEKSISSVQVSDLAGQALSNTAVNGSECSIPLGNAAGSINIVTIRYADGSQTTIKVPTIK